MSDTDQNKSEGEIKQADPTPPVAEPSKPVSRGALYALAVIAFGILAGIGTAAFLFHESEVTLAPAPAPTPSIVSHDVQDLGSAEASINGMKGHLTTQWSDQPKYRVTIEPSDPTTAAGFALAISQPPHPLSIQLQLKDRLGYVMCVRDVLLKFPPEKPADLEKPDPELASGKSLHPKKISAKEQERIDTEQADYDRAVAREQQREKGRDVFQTQSGPDGQIVSISAQGPISCPSETYSRLATWGFIPDFPSVDEQDEMLASQPPSRQSFNRVAVQGARRRLASKSPTKAPSFSLEGDDAVVDFDVSGGVLETKAGKTFLIEKAAGETNMPAWQEYPAYFHYRCEQTTSSCTLARSGAGVIHGKLKR